tara:strand:- start:1015 stop:1962 length:948 start_codon:yes stop_codon:yes gene_type:complete
MIELKKNVFGALIIGLVVFEMVGAEECAHSKWGEDDEIGAANYVNPSQIIMATKLVKKGKSHGLGIVIEPGMPAFPPRYLQLQAIENHLGDPEKLYGWPVTIHDDILQTWLGLGPQIDGLGHAGESGNFYNCNKGSNFRLTTGLAKLGIEKIPPLIGRGILLDMTKYFDTENMTSGQPITSKDIRSAAKNQGVTFQDGDVILFHTGWTDAMLRSEPEAWVSSEPGITNEAAAFIASLNPMAVGADTWGLGAVPPIEGDRVFYDHVILLKENGIYILETMNTGTLAEEGVHEFMFVLGQAKIKGAVQMMINPIAIW